MKRGVISVVLLAVLAGLWPATVSAQLSSSVCTDQVYIDVPGYTPDTTALVQVMNELKTNYGMDTRAVIVEDFDDKNVKTVPQFDTKILNKLCPMLYNNGEPKSDLFMLVVATKLRQKGMVYGGQWARYRSEEAFSDASNSFLGAGNFTGGLAVYFGVIKNRIANGQSGQAAPELGLTQAPPVAAAKQPDKPVDLTWFWRSLWFILGAIAIAGLVILISRSLSRHGALKRTRGELLSRYQTAASDYLNIEGRWATIKEFNAAWIAQLPDVDEADLVGLGDRIKQQMATAAKVITSSFEASLGKLKTDGEIEGATNQLDRLEAALSGANSAIPELEDLHNELNKMQTEFDAHHKAAESGLIALGELIEAYRAKGFHSAQGFAKQFESLQPLLVRAQSEKDSGAIVTAERLLDEIDAHCANIRMDIEACEKRPGELLERAQDLDAEQPKVQQLLKAAMEDVADLKSTYNESCWGHAPDNVGRSINDIDEINALLEEAKTASSMEVQDFDKAYRLLEDAERRQQLARSAATEVAARLEMLAGFAEQLPTQLKQLGQEIETDLQFARHVRDDVGDEPQDRYEAIKNRLDELIEQLDRSKPDYAGIADQQQRLAADLDELDNSVRQRHQDMEALREKVRQAKARAMASYARAGQYSSYGGGYYSTAGGYFHGVLVGMTLQQELEHWERAEQAADEAYDHGLDAYEDAHRPPTSYGSSGSSGSSYGGSDTGGSSGSGFGGFGGGGGSSGSGF